MRLFGLLGGVLVLLLAAPARAQSLKPTDLVGKWRTISWKNNHSETIHSVKNGDTISVQPGSIQWQALFSDWDRRRDFRPYLLKGDTLITQLETLDDTGTKKDVPARFKVTLLNDQQELELRPLELPYLSIRRFRRIAVPMPKP